MPIPQLKNNNGQAWRRNRKKYYISRDNKKASYGSKSKKADSGYKFKGRNKKRTGELKKKLLYAAGIIVLACFLAGIIFYAWLLRGIADISKLTERQLVESTKIYDRTGEELLYEIHGDIKRTEVKLEDIPDYIKWATVAMEDKNFYKHKGISLWGIFRGVVVETIRSGRAQGGSTLTQQFVKNAILTPERKVTRKLKEWILSYRIEKQFSKDEILEMYLNEIPYGSTAYGVEAASERYFGKKINDISLAEAALLAALPQAPSRYSPYGPNRDLLIGRQQYILDLMVAQGYIDEADADIAKAYELEFKPPEANIKAPHFVMYVKEILSEKYGEKTVEQGGLKIYTTLDLYKQEIAEEVVREQAEKNEKNYLATNAALVSIDPKTGQILAMVGSRDYFDDEIDGQVNIATAKRQPGSSLKPIVYATAFIKGYTPDTILYDVVTNFSNDEAKPYEPHNYDNQEHGPVTIRKALAGSLNIPAVKAIYLAGIESVLDVTRALGYTTLNDKDRFGLSLVLGGGEVKLLEHVSAYGAFAREGMLHPVSAILKIEDREGALLEEFKDEEIKALDPKVARLINDIMSDNNARAYAFGEGNWLTLGSRPVAAKTGTTNDYRDAWTVGYTPSLVTGVWVGNNDNSEMKRGAAGATVAAPIWHNYMDRVLGDTPVEQFKKPEIVKTGKAVLDGQSGISANVKIDKITGLLATENTPPELIVEKSFFEPHSILYYVDKNNPRGDIPSNPAQDPQFNLWESRIKEWAKKQSATSSEFAAETPPTEYDNVHVPENIPTLEILYPNPNQAVIEPLLIARVSVSAPRGIDRVEYYINDILFLSNSVYPFNMEKEVNFLPNGFHNLKIRACDDADNCAVDSREFNLILENSASNNDTSISLNSPGNGLAVSNIDFPITIELNITNPGPVANVNILAVKDGETKPIILNTIAPLEGSRITWAWPEAPVSGTYKIYAEAQTWDKKILKTNEAVLIVNNIQTVNSEVNDAEEKKTDDN